MENVQKKYMHTSSCQIVSEDANVLETLSPFSCVVTCYPVSPTALPLLAGQIWTGVLWFL